MAHKKATGKVMKQQKMRLKHTLSTVQPNTQIGNLVNGFPERQSSPEVRGELKKAGQEPQKSKAIPRFDLKKMSSRN